MSTRFSIFDKDALELKKSLEAIIPHLKVEEEHYRPRNIDLEKIAKRDSSSNVTLPLTPPTDIAYAAIISRVRYGSDLQCGEIRRGLYFSGKNIELELRNGDFNITCALKIKGTISKRKELQRDAEKIVREFYEG